MRAIGELVDAFRRREGKAVTRARNLIVAALAAGRKCYHYDRQHLVGRVLGPERGGMPDWISPAAENTAFGRGDVLVIGSQLGAVDREVAYAEAAASAGAKIVVVAGRPARSALGTAGRPTSGRTLWDVADVGISTHVPMTDGVVDIKGLDRPFGPASGAMGLVAFWSLAAAVSARLAWKGFSFKVAE